MTAGPGGPSETGDAAQANGHDWPPDTLAAALGTLAASAESNGASRPVIHEYQFATPLPLSEAEVEQMGHGVATVGAAATPDAADAVAPEASIVRELVARVEELLHRTRGAPPAADPMWSGTIRFGSVVLEPATQTVTRHGQPVRITQTEYRLLMALVRRRGAIASRRELLREVWGHTTTVSRRVVDTHVARLRRKVEDDPAHPRHILTALAWGYRFRP